MRGFLQDVTICVYKREMIFNRFKKNEALDQSCYILCSFSQENTSQFQNYIGFIIVSLFFFPHSNMANALANASCELCKAGFTAAEKIVNSNGELYHEQCFVCAQCFQQFSEGLYYEVCLLFFSSCLELMVYYN